ncbi:MAG: hypothetical protein OJF47_003517 [Nitrospira sp.]|jgi:hypothetical protein|nr:MAG: hypothetical protein OJF47_003517 [Nitrospira sp.]
MKRDRWLYGIALLSGTAVWAFIAAVSGRGEAWDSELYVTFGIPFLCLVAGLLGYLAPSHPWRWGVIPLVGQALWLFAAQGLGNLWVLGLVMFGIYAVPSIVAARLGAAVANRRG